MIEGEGEPVEGETIEGEPLEGEGESLEGEIEGEAPTIQDLLVNYDTLDVDDDGRLTPEEAGRDIVALDINHSGFLERCELEIYLGQPDIVVITAADIVVACDSFATTRR